MKKSDIKTLIILSETESFSLKYIIPDIKLKEKIKKNYIELIEFSTFGVLFKRDVDRELRKGSKLLRLKRF